MNEFERLRELIKENPGVPFAGLYMTIPFSSSKKYLFPFACVNWILASNNRRPEPSMETKSLPPLLTKKPKFVICVYPLILDADTLIPFLSIVVIPS